MKLIKEKNIKDSELALKKNRGWSNGFTVHCHEGCGFCDQVRTGDAVKEALRAMVGGFKGSQPRTIAVITGQSELGEGYKVKGL